MSDPRRALPSVSALLESAGVRALLESAPRGVVVDAVRAVVSHARFDSTSAPTAESEWTSAIADRIRQAQQASLRPVLNATGIVLHTNLGRAPLAADAIDAMTRIAAGYSNLEYDLDAGARGSRYTHCASLLRELTGVEDALVVNNCAAALVLALNTISEGREAILSRGELVEIGGSFRVHEIIAKSGAVLREVGATNRTHLADYERAAGPRTGAILKVHRSNFAIEGFVADTPVRDLVPLAQRLGVPVVHDLGSGLLISLAELGLEGEPTVREAFAAGASVVVMSADKLLGGPQAGIIIGSAALLAAMRANPLARSYRVDKLTLAALEATLTLYREPERAMHEIPALALLGASLTELRSRATRIHDALTAAGARCEIVDSVSTVGAGAFPSAELPSFAVTLVGEAEHWARRLRAGTPAVIGRVRDDAFMLDVRAIAPTDVDALITAVLAARD
ncbi:MAG TPA: L-seryl-tRNA(Sec) selenium transferase [Gemmatimonadaceae bacterium]